MSVWHGFTFRGWRGTEPELPVCGLDPARALCRNGPAAPGPCLLPSRALRGLGCSLPALVVPRGRGGGTWGPSNSCLLCGGAGLLHSCWLKGSLQTRPVCGETRGGCPGLCAPRASVFCVRTGGNTKQREIHSLPPPPDPILRGAEKEGCCGLPTALGHQADRARPHTAALLHPLLLRLSQCPACRFGAVLPLPLPPYPSPTALSPCSIPES